MCTEHMFGSGWSYMDIQLYFDLIVYPELTYMLEQYKLGNISKEVIISIANRLCDVENVSTVGQVAQVMGTDAMKWFLRSI